jgi:hypothetical protein
MAEVEKGQMEILEEDKKRQESWGTAIRMKLGALS